MEINDKYINQSVYRALLGLEMAAAHGRVKPNELAEQLGINRSSAYRLLSSLDSLGYLYQDSETKHFFPNYEKLISLLPSTWGWIRLAEQPLFALCNDLVLRTNLGTISNGDIIYARSYPPKKANYDKGGHIPQGAHKPSYITALGKSILAFQYQGETLDEYIERGLIKLDSRFPLNADNLLTHLREIRENGYAIDDEELMGGIRCVASPIFDSEGNVIASVGVSGSTDDVTIQKLPEIAHRVIQTAVQISNILKTANYKGTPES